VLVAATLAAMAIGAAAQALARLVADRLVQRHGPVRVARTLQWPPLLGWVATAFGIRWSFGIAAAGAAGLALPGWWAAHALAQGRVSASPLHENRVP
jgi:hypothetical protein